MSVSAVICWEAMANSYKEKSLSLRRGPIYFSWPCCTDHQHCRENSAVSQPCQSLLLPDSAYRSATPQRPIIKSLNSSEFKRGDLISKLLFHHCSPMKILIAGWNSLVVLIGIPAYSVVTILTSGDDFSTSPCNGPPLPHTPIPIHLYLGHCKTYYCQLACPLTLHSATMPWECTVRLLQDASQGKPRVTWITWLSDFSGSSADCTISWPISLCSLPIVMASDESRNNVR